MKGRKDGIVPLIISFSAHCTLALLSKVQKKRIFVKKKTSQELRMLSRSLADCKSLTLNFIVQVSQFVSYSQLCHY